MWSEWKRDLVSFLRMPRTTVNLAYHRTGANDPFFGRIVLDFYRHARRRHPKFPLVRALEYGVALCALPDTFADYFARIDGSARRNFKKAERVGCVFERIDFNEHLDEIGAIRRSAEVRQGRVPTRYLTEDVAACTNPPSHDPCHDYPYFGIFCDDKLVAYAGCLVSGELCYLAHILGHADYFGHAVVPQLIIAIARHLREHHPAVRSYAYGTYFGGGRTLRRFKRKFDFLPHRVKWVLGTTAAPNVQKAVDEELGTAHERQLLAPCGF